MDFCYCGLFLKDNKCPRHKDKITKEKKASKRGHFSGKSKYRNKHGYFQAIEGR